MRTIEYAIPIVLIFIGIYFLAKGLMTGAKKGLNISILSFVKKEFGKSSRNWTPGDFVVAGMFDILLGSFGVWFAMTY